MIPAESDIKLRKENQSQSNGSFTEIISAKSEATNEKTSISYKSFALLIFIFASSLFLLYLVYLSFPNLEEYVLFKHDLN